MTQPAAPLFNPDGTPAKFDDASAAQQAVIAGQARVQAQAPIRIRLPDGGTGTVPGTDLAQALKAGASLLTTQDEEDAARASAEAEVTKLRDERRGTGLGMYERAVDIGTGLGRFYAGGLAGVAVAPGAIMGPLGAAFGGAEEAARSQGREEGWSLGLSKVARKAATEALYGKEAADKLVRETQLTQALEPEAYAKGAAEGSIESAAATMATGPGSGLAKFAAGPAAVPELAGALAHAGLSKAGLTVGQTMAGQAIKGAVSLGVRSAVEGAIVGGAQELSEEMFGDPKVSAEKVWLAAGKGALQGFAAGAVLGGVMPFAGRALQRTADALEDTTTRAEARVRTASAEQANEQAFRALSPHPARKFTMEAEARVEGGIKAVGEFARKEGLLDVSSAAAAATKNTPEQILARTEAKLDDIGQSIGERMRSSEARITGKDLLDITKKLVSQADETGLPLNQQAGRGNVVRGLQDYVTDLFQKAGMLDNAGNVVHDATMPMADAFAQRRALDNKIFKDYSALEAKGPMELLRKFRGEFDDLLIRKMEEAGEAGTMGLGPQAGKTLRELKGDYQKATIAKKIVEDGIVKNAKNRAISPTDYLTGIGSFAVTGDPLTGLASSYAHKVVRERGNAVAAYALGKIGDMQTVAKAIERTDKMLAQAADGATGTRKLPYRSSPSDGTSLRKRYDAAAEHTRELAQQSEQVKARAAELSRINGAPNISTAYANTIARAATSLVAMLPDAPLQTSPMHKPRPSDEEMRKFLGSYDALTNPEGTLKEIAAGSLDPAKTRALEQVAPDAFATLRDDIEKKTLARIERGDLPKQADLMKLHLAFGITLDPTMTPQALLAQQQALATPTEGEAPQQGGGQGPGRRGRASSLKQQRQPTGADRFER